MTSKILLLTLAGTFLLSAGEVVAQDPSLDGTLVWHTYMGGHEQANGTNHDLATGMAIDASGYVYIVGHSVAAWNTDWDGDGTQDKEPVNAHHPIVGHAHQDTNRDVFVAKFDREGNLIWHTFMGTPVEWWGSDYRGWSGQDDGLGIAIDSARDAVYVTGMTTNDWNSPTYEQKERYAFLARLDAATGARAWHRFMGAYNLDVGHAVAVDGDGNVYVTGQSWSAWGGPIRSHYGGYGGDAFVAKFAHDGTMDWNTFLGGTNGDTGNGIVLDAAGNIFVAGTSSLYYTDGTWGGTTAGQLKSPAPDLCPSEPYLCGSDEAFVARLNGSGELQWYGFYGGTWRDWGNGIDVDQSGHLYLVGDSDAPWGDATGWTDLSDAFAAKIDVGTGARVWNRFMGGPMADTGHAITVDSIGRVFVTGWDFGSYWGGQDLFAAALDNDGNQLWSPPLTLLFDQPDDLGWGGHEDGYGIAFSEDGYLYVAGYGQYERGSPRNHHSDVRTGLLTGNDVLIAKLHASLPETDTDGDGVPNNEDNCPDDANADQADSDDDFIGDACDVCPLDDANDADEDGICGDIDNCPTVSNSDQVNSDGQGLGDACLAGFDNDGDWWENQYDNCVDVANSDQANADGDVLGDACDSCPLDEFNDADADGFCANDDNCPLTANSDQIDTDLDELGNACDHDDDGDSVLDVDDNCPLVANSNQADFDGDGAGDYCDMDVDGDNVVDANDDCPLTEANALVNLDGCAIAQLCPCDGAWRNHGKYVSCVAHAANDFRDAGLINENEHGIIVSNAGMSDCGQKR